MTLDEVVALCKRRGFVFQSSEIYGGLASTYDYGHYGVLLKNNVKAEWWRAVRAGARRRGRPRRGDPHAPPHLGGLRPPGGLHRPDGRLPHLQASLPGRQARGRAVRAQAVRHPGEFDECDLTEPRQFNLMFKTYMGPVREDAARIYLRPETAQGIFVNFKNVLQFARKKPPFGIAQIGKAFRNEITPGNFIFRTREFEMMEIEYFVPPDRGRRVAPALDGRPDALVHGSRDPPRPSAAPRARAR